MPIKDSTREQDKDRMILLGRLIFKYIGAEPKLAMKELMQIDFVRKNFSEKTIYCYFLNTKRMLKNNLLQPKGLPTNLVKTVFKLAGKVPNLLSEKKDSIQIQVTRKPVEETLEQKIDKLIEEGESLNKKYAEASTKLDKELAEVKRKQEALQKAYMLEADRIGNGLNELYAQQAKEMLV